MPTTNELLTPPGNGHAVTCVAPDASTALPARVWPPGPEESLANSIVDSPLDRERADTLELRSRTRFATCDADPPSQERQRLAYDLYARLNRELFDGALRGARVDFAHTAARSLCQFRSRTGYGARSWIVLSRRFAVEAD